MPKSDLARVIPLYKQGETPDSAHDAEHGRAKLPGEPGVWVFITGDVCLFMLYFLVFTVGRLEAPAMYELGRRQLNASMGFVLTLILLTSSYLVVRAVEAAREGSAKRVRRNLLLAMLFGSGFAALKVVGYIHDIMEGHSITSNQFFGYYFAITGIHFMHVMLGMLLLTICFVKAGKQPIDEKYLVWIESGGCFWHMVDMLWVMLFPMFYLLGGQQ